MDILRGGEEGDKAGSEEKQAGVEKGLHLADPNSGAGPLVLSLAINGEHSSESLDRGGRA